MDNLITNLVFTQAEKPDVVEKLDVFLPSDWSQNYHFKLYGQLLSETVSQPTLYAFFEDLCIGRICPRHKFSELEVQGSELQSNTGKFVDWISVFGLPAEFTIRLYVGEFGLFEIGRSIYQSNHVAELEVLGTISGTKKRINQATSRLKPLRVSNFGRTGSSLMMRYLSLHPQIAVAGSHPYEVTVARHYYLRTRQFSTHCEDWTKDQFRNNNLGKQNPWYQYEQVQWMGSDREQFFGKTQIAREIEFCRESVDEFYHGFIGDHEAPQYFCEKLGSGVSGHDEYLEVWPEARRIFLIRDFRDNCASMLAYCERKGTKEFGLQFFQDQREWVSSLADKAREMLKEYRSGEASSFVFYEQLVTEPEVTLKKAFRELEIESDDELLKSIVSIAAGHDEHQKIAAHFTSENAEASIGRWKEDLPAELLHYVDSEFADVLEAFGYSTRQD